MTEQMLPREEAFFKSVQDELIREALRLAYDGVPLDRIVLFAMGATNHPGEHLVRALDAEKVACAIPENPPPVCEEYWCRLIETPSHGSPRLLLYFDDQPVILRFHLGPRTH